MCVCVCVSLHSHVLSSQKMCDQIQSLHGRRKVYIGIAHANCGKLASDCLPSTHVFSQLGTSKVCSRRFVIQFSLSLETAWLHKSRDHAALLPTKLHSCMCDVCVYVGVFHGRDTGAKGDARRGRELRMRIPRQRRANIDPGNCRPLNVRSGVGTDPNIQGEY